MSDKKERTGGEPDYAVCHDCKKPIPLNQVHECPGTPKKGTKHG